MMRRAVQVGTVALVLLLFVISSCASSDSISVAPVATDAAAAGEGSVDHSNDPVSGPVVADANADVSPSPASNNTKKPDTIAHIIDQALIKEFNKEEQQHEKEKGKDFNKTVAEDDSRLETVVRISAKGEETVISGGGSAGGSEDNEGTSGPAANGEGAAAGEAHGEGHTATDGGNTGDAEGGEAKDEAATPTTDIPKLDRGVDRIIDSQDNEFVLSKPKETVAALTLDPQLVQDVTFLLGAAAVVGMVFEYLKQPVINGYLVAGALVGPGGFQLIKELVQVESLAQVGVELLLFGLGLELSLGKLKAVWGAAIVGGLIQILMLVVAMGALAAVLGASVGQGIFVGAVVSMSSTSVVVKCLESMRATNSNYGQIVIGTLLLQDCCVGLMFALMPVLSLGTSSVTAANDTDRKAAVMVMVLKLLIKLVVTLMTACILAYTLIPPFLRSLTRYCSKELVQLTLVGICLLSAWLMGELGLSEELGAFVAGAMLAGSRTAVESLEVRSPSAVAAGRNGGGSGAAEAVHAALHSIGSVQNVMAALFVASIGMVMSPVFLMHHISVLAAGTVVVVVVKAVLVGGVVHFFGVSRNTSAAVGISMAHIGEFGIVLLSMANQHSLLSNHVYMLLLGITALSLLTTPMVIMVCNRLLRSEAPRGLPRHNPKSSDDNLCHVPLAEHASTAT